MKIREAFDRASKNQYFFFAYQVIIIFIGCFIMGFAYRSFYIPNNITPSGFSGIATMIHDLLLMRANIDIPFYAIYLSINAILFIFAFRYMGLRFGLLTLIGTLAYSGALEIVNIPLPTNDALLACLLGGALMGIGSGIVFRVGASTGGTDIVALLINKFFPKVRTGQCLIVFNIFVIIASILVYGVNASLYAIIAIYICGKMTDSVIDGSKSVRAYYIVCEKDEEIADKILTELHRGVTRLNAEGVFSKNQKKLLVCLVTNKQAHVMRQIIKTTDPKSFVYSTTVREAIGETQFLKEEQMYKELRLKDFWKLVNKKKNRFDKVQPLIKDSTKFARFSHTKLSRQANFNEPHSPTLAPENTPENNTAAENNSAVENNSALENTPAPDQPKTVEK